MQRERRPAARACAFLLGTLWAAGCSSVLTPDGSPDELMAADRSFAAATAARGLEGWMSFYCADAVRIAWDGPAARGLAAIREFDRAMFQDPSVQLRWDPDDAGLLGPGLGYTRGKYEVVKHEDGGGRLLGTGRYLSIWRKVDGAWKVVLDTGVADPKDVGP